MTSPNPKGLAAYLETDPEEVAGWVENGQLRLFAATLSYLTYTVRTSSEHKVADIQGVLDPLVEQTGDKWKTWWKKVQPWVKESKYFSPGEARYTYRLAPGNEVGKIPAEPLPGKPIKKVKSIPKPSWNQWLTSKRWPLAGKDTLPSTKPPDKIIHNIGSCAPDVAERLALRTVDSTLEFVNRSGTKAESAQKWLELLLAGLSRYHELLRLDTSLDITLQGAKGLDGLIHTLLNDGNQHLLADSVKLAVSKPARRKVLGWGVWHTYNCNSEGTREFLEFLVKLVSDSQDRLAVWNDILLAAFAPWSFAGRIADLDRILSYLHREERAVVLQGIILQAALGAVNAREVADFVTASRYAGKSNEPQKLNALVTAGLLLQEGTDNLIDEVSDAYKVALSQNDEWGIPLVDALVDASRDHIASLNKQWQDRLDKREDAFAEERKGWQDEISHQTSQLRALRAEMVSGRKKSNLEVRSGMLLRIGDILQGTYRADKSPESRLNDVMERLPMVLNDGDAELFGTVGSIVEYDGKLHHTTAAIPRGGLVRIAAPGIIVKDTSLDDNDPVLLKATVIPETQEA